MLSYYIQIFIEEAGTSYVKDDGTNIKSFAGHMWFRIYALDKNGNELEGFNAGYTQKGIVGDDDKRYLGDAACKSEALKITQTSYERLKEFATKDSSLVKALKFDTKDYNFANNSCVDYVWKALNIAGYNEKNFEGNLVPMINCQKIQTLSPKAVILNKDDLFYNFAKILGLSSFLFDFNANKNNKVGLEANPFEANKQEALFPNTINSHRKGEIKLQIQALADNTKMPIIGAKIQLENINLAQRATTNAKGIAGFSIKESEYLKPFKIKLVSKQYEEEPLSHQSIIPNAYRNANKPLSLRFLGKIKCYFNGKELYLSKGGKVIAYFSAYSGKALGFKEKEKILHNFEKNLVYKELEEELLYKKWQGQKNEETIPEGTYYLALSKDEQSNEIKEDKNPWLFKTKEEQTQPHKIPIYTDQECTSTIETKTQRKDFVIYEEQGYKDGIYLGKEYNEFIASLELLKAKFMHTNSTVKSATIELVVDYSLDLSLKTIELERTVSKENHRVFLSGVYDKPKEMKEESFQAQKLQTYWAYKEILQDEELNFDELSLKSLTLFKKGQRAYRGENLELDLVEYNWHHYNKQIIVFAFLDTDMAVNSNEEVILKDPKWRIITWHNPLVNPRITLFTYSGKFNPKISMFGYFAKRSAKKHQGVDFFAKIGTKLYAPLDCEVVNTAFSSSYGQSITLKLTGSDLEILKIRKEYINYQLCYADKDNAQDSEIKAKDFNEESKEYYLFYAHLSSIINPKSQRELRAGDRLLAGELIGLSGSSGNAKGTKALHVHFEIRDKDIVGKGLKHRINPLLYIECKKLYAEFSQEEKKEQENVCKELSTK
ncbi:M23 family metallopeptidase [Campylobacter troglodytis]|uniref:M23 family metallopeptidase n=1 Tax=Campylobacter troglodytis TaxID=654363 RepID=UPI00115A6C90|nr:M23 family metallopeptidase [Campylobacter troglodytis]TQR53274.1 hypothetical protein DMC01_11490 [Campylobacter troglodytis]